MKTILYALSVFISAFSFSQVSNCLKLDGNDDYVNLDVLQSDFYANSTSFTIEFWMMASYENQSGNNTVLFAINQPTSENRLLIVLGGQSGQEGLLAVYDEVPGSGELYISTDTVADGECHHIAYVYDGANGHVYIDGQLEDTHSPTFSFNASDRFSIGQEWDNSSTSQFYNGTMDDLRIWKVVRSANEIQNNMSVELNGTDPELIAYYNFNQGIDSGNNTGLDTLVDVTGNGNTGDLMNFELNYSNSNWVRSLCVNPPLSIDELHEEAGFYFYPNPANEVIYLTLDEQLASELTITLFDLSGKQVSTVKQQENVSSIIEIDVHNLVSGTYLLQVASSNQIITKKVQIMH